MCRVVKDNLGNVQEVYAANGNPSVLFASLVNQLKDPNAAYDKYLEVHTDEFKIWFGDWVTDSANASKAVDVNGEPRITITDNQLVFTADNNTTKSATDNINDYRTNNNSVYNQVTSSESRQMDAKLNSKINNFLDIIGVPVQSVNSLTDKYGNPMSGIAKADMLEQVISIVEGKAKIDTLPEEASHFFVEILKSTGNPLYKSMSGSIKNYAIYQQTLTEYSDNPLYLNEDGSINESKITDEAIGKAIAREIVNLHLENESEEAKGRISRWVDKVLNFIKKVFGSMSSDPYKKAAYDLLNADKIAFDQAAKNITSPEEYLQKESKPDGRTKQERVVQSMIEVHGYIEPEEIEKSDLKGSKYQDARRLAEMTEEETMSMYRITLPNGKTYISRSRVSYESQLSFLKVKGLTKAKKINQSQKAQHAAKMGTHLHNAAQAFIERYATQSKNIRVQKTHDRGILKADDIATDEYIGLNLNLKNGKEKRSFLRLADGVKDFVKFIGNTQKEIDEEGTAVLMTELGIHDDLTDVTGTQDVVVVYSNGKMGIYDWKFSTPQVRYLSKQNKSTRQLIENPHLVKLDGWSTQQGAYRKLNEVVHNVPEEDVIHSRIIPAHVEYNQTRVPNKDGKGYTIQYLPEILSLNIGASQNEFLEQVSVAQEKVFKYKKLNSLLKNIYDEQKRLQILLKKPGTDKKYEETKARYTRNERAIQQLVVRQDIGALIDTVVERVKQVDARAHIVDVTDPQYMDKMDRLAAMADLTMFSSINLDTAGWVKDMISKDAALGNALKAQMASIKDIVDGAIEQLRDASNSELIQSSKSQQDPINIDYPQIGYWGNLWSEMSEVPHPIFRVTYQKFAKSFEKTRVTLQKTVEDVEKHKNELEKWSDLKYGKNNILKAYDMLKGPTGNLLDNYSPEFREEIDKRREAEDIKWFKDTFKVLPSALTEYKKMRNQQLSYSKSFVYDEKSKSWKETDSSKEQRAKSLASWTSNFNIFDPSLTNRAWLNNKILFRFAEPKNPKEHYSKEYTEITKPENKALFDYYKMYKKYNKLFNGLTDGRIDENFISNAKDSILDSIINNGFSMGQFYDSIQRGVLPFVEAETEGVIGPDGKFVNQIPLPYSSGSLKNAKGDEDFSLQSRDMSKSLLLLAGSVYNYRNMSDIEGYVMAMKDYMLNTSDEIVLNKQGEKADASTNPGMSKNPGALDLFDMFVNYYLYGQGEQQAPTTYKGFSPTKLIRTLQTVYSVKALGMAIVPAAAARIAGGVNMYMEGVKSIHFTTKQLKESDIAMVSDYKRFEYFVASIDPFQSGRFRQQLIDISAKPASKWLNMDTMFWFIRNADENMDAILSVAMSKNHGLNKEGQLKRLQQLPDNAKSLWDMYLESYKEGGVLPEAFKQGTEAHRQFRERVKEVAKKFKGRMDGQNVIAINTLLAGKLVMHFRGWMPGILHERFKSKNYNRVLDILEEGKFVGTWHGGSFKEEMEGERKLLDILVNTSKRGIKALQTLAFLKKFTVSKKEKARLEARNRWGKSQDAEYNRRREAIILEFRHWARKQSDPKVKDMDVEDYIKMRESSVRSTMAEVRAYLGLFAGLSLAGMKVGDDDEPLYKSNWATRKLFLILNRARLEMGFSMNPTELAVFMGSIVPLVGLFEDIIKIGTNGFDESLELMGITKDNPYDYSPLFHYSSPYLVPGINQISKIADIYETDKRK